MRVSAVAVCLAFVGQACAGSEPAATVTSDVATTVVTPEDAPADTPPDTGAPLATFEALTAGGITVTPIEDPQVGEGVTVTDFQADNLLRQAAAGTGFSGERLDEMVPTADDEYPMSYVVATWLLAAESPAADAARALLPAVVEADPATLDVATVVFPTAVLALFVQDLAAHPGTDPAGFAPAGFAPVGLRGGAGVDARQLDPCGAVMAFYEGTIGKVQELLGGASDYLVSAFDKLIGLPPPYKGIKIPQKGNDRSPFRILGFLVGLAGALTPWTVTLTSEPGALAGIPWGVSPAPGNDGVATVNVDPGLTVEWPQFMKSCASLVGVELPDLNPVGATVEWDFVGAGQATKIDEFQAIMPTDDGYGATLTYRTMVEDADTAANGVLITDVAVVSAKVTRNGNENLTAVISNLISSYLSDGVLGLIVQTLAGDVVGLVEQWTEPNETILVVHVTHHAPPVPSTLDTGVPPAESVPSTVEACAGRDLFSVGQEGMPAGIRLRIDGNTVVFDFNGSQPIDVDGAGLPISVQLAGTITGSVTPGDGFWTSDLTGFGLVTMVTIDGVTTALDPTDLVGDGTDPLGQSVPTTGEILLCGADGSVTVQRTGQVFAGA